MSRHTPLRRDVVLMVIAGAILGIVYNGMGLASRPARGIPWVAAKAELATLEDLVPADTGVAAPGGETAAPDGPATPRPAPATPAPAAAPSRPAATTPPATDASRSDPGARQPPVAEPTPPPAPAAADPAPAPSRAAPLPFIPDSDQPIQLQVATVKRFFDARAALFLDARDPAEYEKGHIPGAIRLTNVEAQNEPERMKAIEPDTRPTIVYCEGGTCEASLELARFLIESGRRKVLVYMGGFPEWAAAGHPVTRGSAP